MTKNTKICKNCRKGVDIQAKKCPYCQLDLRNWFRRHPILTFIFVLLLLSALVNSVLTSNNSSPSIDSEVIESPEKIEQAEAKLEEALDGYMALINSSGMNEYVSQVNANEGDITITVRNVWHYQPKQVRLQATQVLWEAWVGFCPESDADQCRITIKDLNGNKVGGSSWLAGSVIDVDD